MSTFKEYLAQPPSLAARLDSAFKRLNIEKKKQLEIFSFLAPLKIKDIQTYKHSLRVGILAAEIGQLMHLDQKALLYSGLLHDIGKALTNSNTLKKTEAYNEKDYEAIKDHVLDGYKMLQGCFDFAAEIIIWHHKFQANEYPKEMPSRLHDYSRGTEVKIPFYGRLISLVDFYDALHRSNKKFADQADLSGEEMKKRLINFNPDAKTLIEKFYQSGIFTTKLIA
ncbi:MAG: HD domain-containing protein [Candidatus Falkowbacteria bacterium]|nr:HD domain-containing protein [Candidatus Falkowbacteria bacterium]